MLALGWMWWSSLLPDTYDLADMGYADYGGGPVPPAMAGHSHGSAVADLVEARSGPPDREVTLTVRHDGERITVNGATPGPTLRFDRGDLVEVTLVNDNLADGTTLHWHGLDVPNAVDGVAGLTQDAVMPGSRFVYRFVADQTGTYWYHSHQLSHEQVRRGLLGAVVVEEAPERDVLARPPPVRCGPHPRRHRRHHGRAGRARRHGAGAGGEHRQRPDRAVGHRGAVPARRRRRYRPPRAGSGRRPCLRRDRGRPRRRADHRARGRRADRLRRHHGAGARGRSGAGFDSTAADRFLDLLAYGTPSDPGLDASDPDRTFDYRIGRRLGLLDGMPGRWWTINGHLFPNVPMFMVEEGDVVVMRIENHSGASHPMHLHGHHALVLWRDGVRRPAARGGSTRSRSAPASPGRSPSGPTTPGSGWTTATTCPTRRRVWWRHLMSPACRRRTGSAPPPVTVPSRSPAALARPPQAEPLLRAPHTHDRGGPAQDDAGDGKPGQGINPILTLDEGCLRRQSVEGWVVSVATPKEDHMSRHMVIARVWA